MPDPGARAEGRTARDARRLAHRPRLARGCRRAVPGGAQGRREADRRLRGVRRGRPSHADEGLRAPDAPRRDERGVREPHQALLARLPRGLLLQAARRLGAARAAREGHGRALRLPLGPGVARAVRGAGEGRPRGPRPPRPDLRARLDVRRDPERGPRRAAGDQSRAHRARGGDGPPARRHRRRPLPRRRGRVRPRGAALHPVGRHAQEPGALEVRHERVLLQDAGGDGRRLPGARGRHGADARGRRALQRRDRAGEDPAAEVPRARGPRRVRLPRRALREGTRPALREGDTRAHRPSALRAQDDQGDGVRGLLPHRLGLHPLREAERRERRPGARLGGGVDRGVLPRDHGRRPDAVRAPVRALPQPGAQGPAGHGHRLLRRGPRPGHQLRRREVRARPRRPDHHLLDDGRACGDPGRGTRPRHPVRRRRPHREARARRPRPDARGRAQARGRAPPGRRLRSRCQGDRRPRAPARGAHPRGLDPRRRRRHRRPAAHRGRPAPAEGRPTRRS